MSIFDELKTSLEEAVEIHSGRKAASRVTRYEGAWHERRYDKELGV